MRICTARYVSIRSISELLVSWPGVDACKQVTKTVADKMLKEMEQSGAIMGKASNGEKKPGEKRGGQWVFWCKQVCCLSFLLD